MVRSAHGLIPNPSPAAVGLLEGVPTYGIDTPVELTTPTGAALLAALSSGYGPLPPMTIESSGFGAGSKILEDRPNLAQVVVGTAVASLERGQPVVLLEANVDDATGETLAHAIAALLDAGAHDAWITPILMKKGRPAHTVSALADTALARQVAAVLTAETGSLGVRGQQLERWPVERASHEVEVEGRAVRVKVGPGRVKVEHDDAARVARLVGLPLREVVSRAEQAWRDTVADRVDAVEAPMGPPTLSVVDDDGRLVQPHGHGPEHGGDHGHRHEHPSGQGPAQHHDPGHHHDHHRGHDDEHEEP
jgi:hypothetical protein